MQKLSTSSTEFLLITFNCHGPYSACLVQRSGWTRDADAFLQWLSAIPFNGGGFNDAAIAEGLAEALMVFPTLPSGGQVNQTANGQKHCILIAASNPYPLPTLVYCPQLQSMEQGDNIDAQAKSCLSDAETVAKAFPLTSVSLSVICPRRLPKLKQIYDAGKHDAKAEDPHIDNRKNPYFLVLISEKFMEACSALNRPEIQKLPSNQSPVKADVSSVTSATVPRPAYRSLTNQPPVSVGSIPAATVKVEPGTATSTGTGPTSPYIPSLPCPGLQAVPALQTSSPLQDTKPNAAANVNILNNLSQARQVMSSGALSGGSSIGLPAMNQAPVSMHVSSMVQPVQNISQRNSCGQMVQSSLGMNQNMVSNLGPSGTSSSASTIIPTPGITQQIQSAMQSLGAGDSPATMSLSQQQTGSSQSAQPKYVKIWEGKLFFQHQGQPIFITRLEAYNSNSSPETLAANWPPNLQLGRLISQDHMNNQRYAGKTICLAFRTLDQHGYLGIMHRKKLCGVIQLPSQTLLISVSDKASRLIGMLFPGDMVVLKPKVPSQQQQMQQHPQPMQTQQIQPLQHQQQLPQMQQLSPLQHEQLPQFQQVQQQQISKLQQQQQLQQQQHSQQLLQLQQQLPQMQQQQLPHQQQLQQLQQQQQMVGTGMGQTYVGSPVQSFTSQGQVSSQLKPNIPGGGYDT